MLPVKKDLLQRIVCNTHNTKEVRLLRMFTFLTILRHKYTCPCKRVVVLEAMKNIKRINDVSETSLHHEFSPRQIKEAWRRSRTLLIGTFREHNTTVAGVGDKACIICMENVGDYLCVHGRTAHGGVCGSCALRVVVEHGAKCPICKEEVHTITERTSSRAARLKIFDP